MSMDLSRFGPRVMKHRFASNFLSALSDILQVLCLIVTHWEVNKYLGDIMHSRHRNLVFFVMCASQSLDDLWLASSLT